MTSIRIMLGDVPPPLSRELHHRIAAASDMQIVASSRSRGFDLLLAASKAQPDVILMGGENGELPGECSHLLSELPDLKIVVVAEEARTVVLYGLRSQATRFADTSADGLIAAIRAAAAGRADDQHDGHPAPRGSQR